MSEYNFRVAPGATTISPGVANFIFPELSDITSVLFYITQRTWVSDVKYSRLVAPGVTTISSGAASFIFPN